MRRKTIPLQPHDDALLRQLHRRSRFPVDQWAQRPRFMSQFADKWNDLSDRHDTADELRHYIVTKRKSKKWFRFGDEYDRLHAPRKNELSASEWRAFHKIHLELNVGRDRYGADPELRQKLEDRFFARTGRFVSGERLYGLAMAQQKHRVNGWPNILVSPKRGRGYRDIGEVG